MIEITGNLWDQEADALVITTNGFVKNNGEAVMGRGCAKEATERYPGIAKRLGTLLSQSSSLDSNRVWIINANPIIVSFPVKWNWWERGDLALIERSAQELAILAEAQEWERVILPRPGCGNGQLSWEDVRPLISMYLNDCFEVITYARP